MTPLTPWMRETTILPRASMLEASTVAMTSYGPATGTVESVPSISATSPATRPVWPTSVWISTYARTIVRHPQSELSCSRAMMSATGTTTPTLRRGLAGPVPATAAWAR